MKHPTPIQFLRQWKRLVVMPISDRAGGELHVVVCKKNLIRLINDLDLAVEFRTGKVLKIYLSRKEIVE